MHPDDGALRKGLALAEELFGRIGSASFDGAGFTRAAYGPGEQMAHDIVAEVARDLDLEISVDAALNLAITLKGKERGRPLIIGSHLDAVPQGGNFDGLAGVLAGIATLAAFREAGVVPNMDIATLCIRSEENAWFGAQHVGSRAMFGKLSEETLGRARRVDTSRTLRDHMLEAGADLSRIGPGKLLLDPHRVGGYLELHIEQADKLRDAGMPLGIVRALRGNRRCVRMVCRGEHGHSGALARSDRHDAVFAVADLITRMDEFWRIAEEEKDEDLVLTFGRVSTDPGTHAVTVVPGFVETCFDARSISAEVLAQVIVELEAAMAEIAARRGVAFEPAAIHYDTPALMDGNFQAALLKGCGRLGIASMPMISGAGHDAGDFAAAGIRSAMIFVRSENGSHNPNEHMEFADFARGVELMSWFAEEMSQGEIA